TSGLNLNLRDRPGFTYGVKSKFAGRRGPGPFYVKAAVATDVAGAAIRETLHEIDRLRQEAPTDDEVRETQDYMLGVFAYTLQTLREVGNRLEALVAYGLPADYYETYPGVFAEVTPSQILDVAQRHIHPERLAIVACGPADDLRPQLEPFGEVEIVRG
ncbi:MAG: insulinase family protein, partial [Acidobacteriota bacterium]